jgi:hypothetical protein
LPTLTCELGPDEQADQHETDSCEQLTHDFTGYYHEDNRLLRED